jgi:hypothetical protein
MICVDASVVSQELTRVRELMEPLVLARWRPLALFDGARSNSILLG